MTLPSNQLYYTGEGQQSAEQTWRDLPDIDHTEELTHPEGDLASPGLVAAVNVALELGMPLLLTGEPGCGKGAWYRSGYPLQGQRKEPANLLRQDTLQGARAHRAGLRKTETLQAGRSAMRKDC